MADATFTRAVAKDARKFRVFDAHSERTDGLMQLNGNSLVCERGGRQVFRGVSFSLKTGEALLVTGPNGAGKSSLLRMVAGLVRIAGGTLSLEGGDAEASIGEQAHYLGHLDALKPGLTVAENLGFWAEFLGPSSLDIKPALDAVDLAPLADLPAGYLSAGQRRRLSIARLVAVPPRPRSETPIVEGFAVRLLVRRNRLKPGTCRSASSSVSAGVACRSSCVS